MHAKTNFQLLMVVSVLTLMLVKPSISEQPPLSYEKAYQAALSYAGQFWGKVQVGEGTVFVDPTNYPTIYMFTIYCAEDAFPADETISSQVADARAYRLKGEAIEKQGEETKDQALIQKGHQMVEEGWKKMLDEEHFGTVFISALNPDHPGVEMYRGLPLNYVALADAEQIAEKALSAESIVLKRYIFWGLFDYGAEFEANGQTILVNLKTLKPIDTEIQTSTIQSEQFSTGIPNAEVNASEKDGLQKTLDLQPPFEVKLSGVPDYQTEYSRGCAPAASGCVLGYHDASYPDLIDGGNKNTRGHRDPNGYGYLNMIWDQLGPAMNYVVSVGVKIDSIDDGIRAVCNDTNSYSFTVSYGSWGTPSSQYYTVKCEISNDRPMVYTLRYPTYGGGSGYHTVTLTGYGCLKPPWVPDLANLNSQNSLSKITTDTYEYCYICHDNNTTTGETVYLWWSQFMSTGDLITVHPGGGTLFASASPGISLSCCNYPNPFNPVTEIQYSISIKSSVNIRIFNIAGRMINSFEEGIKEPGSYSVRWNGCNESGAPLASGNYFYQIQAGNESKTGRMILLR